MTHRTLLAILAFSIQPAAVVSGDPQTVATTPRTSGERERFLLEAELVRNRPAPAGVTHSVVVTLRQDGWEHDAHVQTIDEQKPQLQVGRRLEIDFRDSYRHNVAAYRLDRLLALGRIPVSVMRRWDGAPASFTWWIDDVLMVEAERQRKKLQPPDGLGWSRDMAVVRLFDQLIFNFDRNLGNLVIDKQWRLWMIDHTRAFKVFGDLRNPKDLGPQCERQLLAALRRLDRTAVEEAMQDVLDRNQIDGLLARRDAILRFYDLWIAEKGEAAVLYDRPARALEP